MKKNEPITEQIPFGMDENAIVVCKFSPKGGMCLQMPDDEQLNELIEMAARRAKSPAQG